MAQETVRTKTAAEGLSEIPFGKRWLSGTASSGLVVHDLSGRSVKATGYSTGYQFVYDSNSEPRHDLIRRVTGHLLVHLMPVQELDETIETLVDYFEFHRPSTPREINCHSSSSLVGRVTDVQISPWTSKPTEPQESPTEVTKSNER